MGIKERFLGIVRSEERDIAEGGFYMTDFKSSETAKNLMRAFAGESQARNR